MLALNILSFLLKKLPFWAWLLTAAAVVIVVLFIMVSSRGDTISRLEGELDESNRQILLKDDEIDRISKQPQQLEAVCKEQVTARETVTRIVYRCEEQVETVHKPEGRMEVISNEKSTDIIGFVNDHLRLH